MSSETHHGGITKKTLELETRQTRNGFHSCHIWSFCIVTQSTYPANTWHGVTRPSGRRHEAFAPGALGDEEGALLASFGAKWYKYKLILNGRPHLKQSSTSQLIQSTTKNVENTLSCTFCSNSPRPLSRPVPACGGARLASSIRRHEYR